jgi:glycosyltransferase involved in cell wall biosynthesis
LKILQLVSDWKWTGPAEPMLVLMQALCERGQRVELVCPEPPDGANRSLWQEAVKRGLKPIASVEDGRSAWRMGDRARVRRLRRWLETEEIGGPFDVVHCWHSRDHVLAARALGRPLSASTATSGSDGRARLVRSLSEAEAIRAWPWNRWLFGAGCDGLICAGEAAQVANRGLRRGRPIAASLGAIDLAALEVHRDPKEIRQELGVSEEAPLIGIVARMQAHRRFDLILEALARIVRERPEVRLVLIGRGTHVEEVVRNPARALGLEANVVFAGYRHDDYADVLSAMDLFTFLVPGSDGTCRALRQAAALGLPLIGTRRGAISEIIESGTNGLVVSESPEALAAAWSDLLTDPKRRSEMGANARRRARERFDPALHAAWMEKFYLSLLATNRPVTLPRG